MSLKTGHFYEFENFRLDPGERVLLQDGKPVALTPKAFHLLNILVENHGHIVDKEKLITEIWPDSFVEDGNLAVSARMLRKALSDDAAHPMFIETIPRRGYRFVAEVKEGYPKSAADTAVNGPAPEKLGRTNRTYYILAGLLLLVAAGVATVWFARDIIVSGGTAPILSAPFSSTRFSTSGTVTNAVISPDGKYAAFTDTSGGSQSLWLRQIDSGENIQIVPSSKDQYLGLAFASNGNSIYFVRRPAEGHSLPAIYRVATFGGIPVKIVDGALNWISLSPDDRQISFVRCRYKPDDYCSLFIADADGSNERRLLTKPSPILIEDSHFSPDGGSLAVAYGAYIGSSPDGRIALVDVATGTETEVMSQRFFDIRSVRWLPSADAVFFTIRHYEDGRVSIWKTPIAGGQPEKLTKDASNYQNLSLDRNGERMIATQVENDFQVYVGTGTDVKALASARDVSVEPNGRITFSTFDGDIWTINADGGERRQLTTGPWGDVLPRFSPDGRYIFFRSNRAVDNHIWRMNSDGTGLVQVSQPTGGSPCGISQDGRWLFYTKDRKLYKTSTDGGDEIKVSDVKLLRPACSPDGNFAAYFFLEKGFKIGVMNTADGKLEKVLNYGDEKILPQRIAWSPDGKTLNFIVNTDGRNVLWQQSPNEDNARMVADLGGDQIRDLAAMPDGKSFAFVRGKWINDAVLITGLK